MSLHIWNLSLNIRESIETPTPKVGAHLGMWRFIPSRSFTLPRAWDVIIGLPSWPTPLQALALVVSPRLGLWHGTWFGVVLGVCLLPHFEPSFVAKVASGSLWTPFVRRMIWCCHSKLVLSNCSSSSSSYFSVLLVSTLFFN